MSRTLLVSHRLPYSIVVKDHSFSKKAGVGGHSSRARARYRLRDSEDVRVLLNELDLLLNNDKMSKDHPLLLKKHPPKWNCGRSADFLST